MLCSKYQYYLIVYPILYDKIDNQLKIKLLKFNKNYLLDTMIDFNDI